MVYFSGNEPFMLIGLRVMLKIMKQIKIIIQKPPILFRSTHHVEVTHSDQCFMTILSHFGFTIFNLTPKYVPFRVDSPLLSRQLILNLTLRLKGHTRVSSNLQ